MELFFYIMSFFLIFIALIILVIGIIQKKFNHGTFWPILLVGIFGVILASYFTQPTYKPVQPETLELRHEYNYSVNKSTHLYN